MQFFKCLVHDSHRSLWARSTNRNDNSGIWILGETVAQGEDCCLGIIDLLDSLGEALAGLALTPPSTPWIIKFHFLLRASVSSLVLARPSASWEIGLVMDGSREETAALRRSLVSCMVRLVSTCTICWLSCTTWWRHQMEAFSALLVICAWNSPIPGEFPAQRPVTRSFDVFVDLRLNKRLCKNNGEAGDLWRYRSHYDVTVMAGWEHCQFCSASHQWHCWWRF